MTLSQIEIFLALAGEKSFSRAATKLGISQSGVSHSLKKLEDELGVHLISRKRKQFQVTEIGQNLLIYCEEIQRQIRNIESEISAQLNGSKENIRIGVLWSISTSVLPKLISGFKRRFPHIDITSIEGTDSEIEGWLCSKAVDMAIFSHSKSAGKLTKITEDRFYVALPEKHPLAASQNLRMHQIVELPFIMSKGGCEPQINGILEKMGISLNIKFEAIGVTTILALVKEDLGISLVPELAIPGTTEGIRFIPVDTDQKRSVYMSVLENSTITREKKASLDAFIEFTLEHLK